MKKERNLLKLLSDQECLAASKETFATANMHKRSAEVNAKEGLHGTAVSSLVLSTEQLVIGILLFIQHLSINVRSIPEVHLFFTDHIIKHKLATYFSMMYPILTSFMGYVLKTKEKLHNPEAEIEYTDEEKAFMSKDHKRIRVLFKDLPEMMDWWDEANMKKNKGLYVNYSESLETPMQVTELEYEQAFKIADKFQKQILDTVSYIEKASDEDKKEIATNRKLYRIDKVLTPIIEERKRERKNG